MNREREIAILYTEKCIKNLLTGSSFPICKYLDTIGSSEMMLTIYAFPYRAILPASLKLGFALARFNWEEANAKNPVSILPSYT